MRKVTFGVANSKVSRKASRGPFSKVAPRGARPLTIRRKGR
jgi:hypothetical protein